MPRIRGGSGSKARRAMEGDGADRDVFVVDVYDIASEIGKECEKIIDQFGADAVTSLMPTVINALELLETLATRNERENTQLLDLTAKVAQLENDKLEKAEYRQRFEKELEAIEEQWRGETKELLALVARLQEENRRLQRECSPVRQPGAGGERGDLLQGLKDALERQRDDIRQKDNLLQEKCCDIDNLKSQVDRLTQSGRELRRKHKMFQSQVRTLCDERADFLVQLQDQQRDITCLRRRLGLAQKENEDLVQGDVKTATNRAVFDLDDPNRPRFTAQELKDILHERNELKTKVSDLEDELETYRPKKPSTESLKMFIPLMKNIENTCILSSDKKLSPEEEQSREDAPVQGPLPYEPDDAPWKKGTETGIRKFFRKLFADNNIGGSGFPRRSLSSITKMALSTNNESSIPI